MTKFVRINSGGYDLLLHIDSIRRVEPAAFTDNPRVRLRFENGTSELVDGTVDEWATKLAATRGGDGLDESPAAAAERRARRWAADAPSVKSAPPPPSREALLRVVSLLGEHVAVRIYASNDPRELRYTGRLKHVSSDGKAVVWTGTTDVHCTIDQIIDPAEERPQPLADAAEEKGHS